MNETYVQVYISRHENLLLDHVRKTLDLETRNVLLEAQVKECQKRTEDLESQVAGLNDMVTQATNGLSAVTVERDQIKNQRDTTDMVLSDCNRQLNDTRAELQAKSNEYAIQQQGIAQLRQALEISQNDYNTLKSNYDLVNNALEQARAEITILKSAAEKKRPRLKSTEWTEGSKK